MATTLVALLICNIISPCTYVFAENNTITISTKEDFIKFSKKCTLDSWSQGKVVNLTCDIDFKNDDFPSIPTFGGTFDGNGYTFSGIKISKNGSYLGVFRYVQQSGKVENLNIKATIVPNGSKSFIGGIAGENCGIIENCSFEGTAKGENVIGGIVGNNSDSGQIISSISAGTISGENSTGGIAGKNEGLILNCTNNSSVNTEYEEKKRELNDINTDADAFIENYMSEQEQTEENSNLGHTDTGGIAGRTSGIVQGCTNNGDIGYQHIGYNVGGICGRQSGYLLGCQNYGFIQGRKDVGGIVGQMEPYILLNTSEVNITSIKTELNKLRSMVDNFIADTDSLSETSKTHLDNISEYAGTAQNNADILSSSATDFVNDNISEINSQTALLSNTLDKLGPVFEDLENGADNIAISLDEISNAISNEGISNAISNEGISDAILNEGISKIISDAKFQSPDFENEIDDLKDAINELSKAERSIKKAFSRAENAIDDLDNAIEFNNQKDVKKAMKELSGAISDLILAKQSAKENIEKIETILTEKPESLEQIGINTKQILESFKIIKTNTDTIISSLDTIGKSIDTVIYNTEIDFYSFKSAANEILHAIDSLEDALYYTMDAAEDISQEIDNLSDAVQDYTDDVNEEIKNLTDNITEEVEKSKHDITEQVEKSKKDITEQVEKSKKDIRNSLDLLSYSMEDIADATDKIDEIMSDLANEEPARFVKLGDDAKNASSDLFNSLSDITNEMDLLKNSLTDGKDTINNNLSSINNQFNVIMNLMIDEIEQITDNDESLSDRFLDVSDEDIRSAKQGKVAECVNYGKIEADRNTGGVVGAMAIEYTKDPEDDIEKPDKLNFTYNAKAVLYYCINEGEVTAKKDCSGGVVGFEEIGTVYGCENYADAKSSNGNYVGGVAGKSESSIRKSFSKCSLSGKKYIGGIAGKADIISLNYAIVNSSGDEYVGSVCGDCEDRNLINRNYFVDSDLGAVDGISYKDKAEPITFDEIKDIQEIPDKFISFKVDFIVENEIISTQEIKYGDKTNRIIYPDIPKKKGHFGVWNKPESEYITENIKVTCEYKPYITLISSDEKNDNGKLALALAEGEFTDESRLNIAPSKELPPKSAAGTVKVYDISLSNTDIKETDNVVLRILNENKDKVTVWILNEGKWEQIKAYNRGKYAVLKTQGTHNVICLKYSKREFNFIWLLVTLLAACVTFVIFLKKRKKKNNSKPNQ